MTNIQPISVQVTERDGGQFLVSPIWPGVDRPNTGGTVVKDRKMADRYTAAVLAGVVFYGGHVKLDVNGSTYIAATSRVLGRIMNADLRRLGF